MIFVTDEKGLVTLLRRPGQRWYSLACFGRKKHYRADGSCKHTDMVLARIKPKKRKLVKVAPFGGKDAPASTTTKKESA